MKIKKVWISLLAGMFTLALGAGVCSGKSMEVNAAETASYWTGFSINGAAVRTEDPVGLRFKTVAERLTPTMKKYNPDAEYYTVLTFTSSVEGESQEYTLTRNADVWRADGSGWNTVLLGIPESDYTTEITAQSFIKLNGRENAFYQTEKVTISITQTAAAAISYGATSERITQYVENEVSSVSLDQTTASMQVGQILPLTATTSPVECMAKWTSSDESVATVDHYGNVKGESVGEAVITAEINGYEASCLVAVEEREETIEDFSAKQYPAWLKFYHTNSAANNGGSLTGLIQDTTDVTQKRIWELGASGKTGDYALRLQTGPTHYPKFGFTAEFLHNVFANDTVTALKFDFKGVANGDRTITTPTANGLASIHTVNGEWITAKITRAAYDVWKTSGAAYLLYSWQNSESADGGCGSVDAYFDNFEYVYEAESAEESRVLTAEELSALDGLMPNYEYNTYQFDFFGYSSLNDGTWDEYDADGNKTSYDCGEDHRNVYRIEEYKETGMTILFPQSACSVSGDNFDFATSKLKEVMDMSVQAGLSKVIVADYRLYGLAGEESIVGAGKQFATTDALDAQIRAYMQDYASHEAFYGVQLLDEPTYKRLTAQGEVYKAIKRCYPDAYIQCNLYPPVGGDSVGTVFPEPSAETVEKYSAYGDLATRFAAFDEYLNMFLDATGADYIMYDQYPLTDNGAYAAYVAGMQVAANICAERGVKFHFVSQTMTMRGDATDTNSRILTEEDLRWLNNMQLGFGVKQLAYFAYFTRNNSSGETFIDGGSFITRNGEKTDIYYAMREILAENKAFASTILSFDYTASATYMSDNTMYEMNNAKNCANGTFAKLYSVQINRESALVSELYDTVGKRYMYMVQNLIDPVYYNAVTTNQTTTLTFNEDYAYAIVWKNGESKVVELENNTFTVKLQSGEAVYVIPFNPDETNKRDDYFIYDAAKGDNCIVFPWMQEENSPWA